MNAFIVRKGTPGFKATKIENKIALRCVQNADMTFTVRGYEGGVSNRRRKGGGFGSALQQHFDLMVPFWSNTCIRLKLTYN